MKVFLIILLLTIMGQQDSLIICDFKDQVGTENWYIVDDGVMGGLSEGNLVRSDLGNALYQGTVRTENNGGFSSLRHGFDKIDVSNYTKVKIKLKGDGKSYQFRIKEKNSQRYSYIQSFQTSGVWEIIELSLTSFYPGFRGNKLDMPNYTCETMEEIAILIGNKRNESFSLEIEKIELE